MLAAIFHRHLVLNPSKSVSLWQHTCATSYQGLWQSNSLSANVALLQSRSALLPAFYSNPETIRNIYSKYKHGWQGRKAAFCCGQFFLNFFIKTWWVNRWKDTEVMIGHTEKVPGIDRSNHCYDHLQERNNFSFKLTRLCFMSSIIVVDESSISTASCVEHSAETTWTMLCTFMVLSAGYKSFFVYPSTCEFIHFHKMTL